MAQESAVMGVIEALIDAGILVAAILSLRSSSKNATEAIKASERTERRLLEPTLAFHVGMDLNLNVQMNEYDELKYTPKRHDEAPPRWGYGFLSNYGPGTAYDLDAYFIPRTISYPGNGPIAQVSRDQLIRDPALSIDRNALDLSPTHLAPGQIASVCNLPKVVETTQIKAVEGAIVVLCKTALGQVRTFAAAVDFERVMSLQQPTDTESSDASTEPRHCVRVSWQRTCQPKEDLGGGLTIETLRTEGIPSSEKELGRTIERAISAIARSSRE